MKRSNLKPPNPPIQIKLRRTGDSRDLSAEILGAYADGPRIIFLGRITDSKRHRHGICFQFDSGRAPRLTCCPEECYLPAEDWPRFLSLPAQSIFRLAGHPWAKLASTDIHKLVGRKRFTCARNLRITNVREDHGNVPHETSTWHDGAEASKMLVELPSFAQKLLATQVCPICRKPFTLVGVTGAGVRRNCDDHRTYFFYEAQCCRCGNPFVTIMTSRPCSMRSLREVLATMFGD